eukprot:202865_1
MPLETRSLRHQELRGEQGKLEIWIEILTRNERKQIGPILDINPLSNPKQYELRVIVWECKNIQYHDEQRNSNDLYVSCNLQCPNDEDEESLQKTDIHFRSRDGFAKFNWRMNFPLKLPKMKLSHYPRLKIQVWDKDFAPDDNISECIIPLAKFLRYAEINAINSRCKMVNNDGEKIWINLDKKMNNIDRSFVKNISIDENVAFVQNLFTARKRSEVLISIELLNNKYVKLLPAGCGRNEPNNYPHLEEPLIGRQGEKLSIFKPCISLKMLWGDRSGFEICCTSSIICCLCFMMLSGAIILANAIGESIFK